ncbi:MAG: peptidoglycan DD-metalloendopeptidase family protein [Phascolarctobacterium sp.]|nr:peptidoglycan DD-metalloendopeptidase family protein [Candidatus Phascolarctobacterium caballi]
MLKKFFAAFLISLFVVNTFGVGIVCADEIDDAKAKKAEVDRQIQIVKQRQAEARRKAQRASKDFKSVVEKLNNLQKRSVDLKSKKGKLETSLENNKRTLANKQQIFEDRKHIYYKRLRDIYKDGQISYLDVLLGSQDFGDFVGRMYLLEKVVNRDINMMREISDTVQDIKDRTQRQAKELKEIKSTQEQIAKDKVYMAELKEKRKSLLESAENEKNKKDAEYRDLVEASERVGQLLKEMEKVNPQRFADKADNFIWPCCGVITSYAGWRIHPVFGTKKYHSGMDIGVDYYTPVKAANRGTVTYAGWMNGYGNVVMIDHGEGLVTLYAHNSSIKCNEGDFVHQGDVVAISGATGWATGPHLHFEVRLHGEVVDPLNYISEKDNIY